jgi:LPS-assembly lipoprotein
MSLSKSLTSPTFKNWPVLITLILGLTTGGCFRPLYGEAANPGLIADMRAIAVEPVKPAGSNSNQQEDVDRIDHYLGNDLIANLNGTGATFSPKYRLNVTTTVSAVTPTVTSQIGLANSYTVTVTASYVLTPVGGGDSLVSGTISNSTDNDVTADRFSNLRAKRDDEIRLAKTLADEIELRVAAFLAVKK